MSLRLIRRALTLTHRFELSYHLSLNLRQMLIALDRKIFLITVRIQNIHSFKIECTNPTHESFLQIFLHVRFLGISFLNNSIRFFKLAPQNLYFFAVACTNVLYLHFNSSFEIFLLLRLFMNHMMFKPSL